MNETTMINYTEREAVDVTAVNRATDRISKKIGAISKGYLQIAGDVALLRDLKGWQITGHRNLYDLCADQFGMARGTVSNLTRIYDAYGSDYKIPVDIQSRPITALLAELKALDAGREDKDAGKREAETQCYDSAKDHEAAETQCDESAENMFDAEVSESSITLTFERDVADLKIAFDYILKYGRDMIFSRGKVAAGSSIVIHLV